MKIDWIKVQGFTTYKDEGVLDLVALGPGIIAVTGPNGSGKTTLLEAVPGAVYRQSPSRGSIATIATARESRIEIAGENGQPFKIRLDVDAHNGKQEAVIFDGAGTPLAGPKVRDFDRYVAEHFAPLDVYLAAAFASQTGVGSVLRMGRSDRRALFGRLLGTERLETMAGAAREKGRLAETELAAVRSALETLTEDAADAALLDAQLDKVRELVARSERIVAEAREAARAALVDQDRLTAAKREALRVDTSINEARRRAEAADREASRIEAGLAALEAVLKQGQHIRKVAADISALSARLEDVRARGDKAAVEERRALDESKRLQEDAVYTAQMADELGRKLAKEEEESERALDWIDAADKSTAAVPCAGVMDDAVRSGCSALAGHFRIREEAKKKRAAIEAGLPALIEKFNAAVKAREEAAGKATAAGEAVGEARRGADAIRTEYRNLANTLAQMKASDRTSELERAETEAGVLKDRLEMAKLQAADAKAELERRIAERPKYSDPEISAAEEVAKRADREFQEAAQIDRETRGEVAKFEALVGAARAAETKAAALRARIAPLERDLGDWRFLARGLGREGVQALELDAAGPRVSALTNELLADAYGPRFQVRFETQAAKADGKGVKETFDIVVVDTERGREGNGEDLSGGEKVIVGEALGLAVGLFHAQAAGVNLGTVIRDETVGALDPENGERYVAMLRAFLRIGGVHQLLYVAHQPALVDMADAVVRVEDGRISLSK